MRGVAGRELLILRQEAAGCGVIYCTDEDTEAIDTLVDRGLLCVTATGDLDEEWSWRETALTPLGLVVLRASEAIP